MTERTKKKVKQSFVMGSLTSSAGVFITKLIGLFYMVPFTALAGDENMAYYSASYSYYNVLLQICSAGLPYAIAAIIAKYTEREDYKTVMLVRKLSSGILAASGFVTAVVFCLISSPLSKSILGSEAGAIDISQMRMSFIILSLALFIVPILYSYRGFYQGFKDLKVYADTQILEQLIRVVFLLAVGWLLVRGLHMPGIWAVYMAILGTSVGALCAIFYYVRYDHKRIGAIARAARTQETEPAEKGEIVKELLAFGLPYLFAAILGNSQTLINTQYFITTMTSLGMKYDTAKIIYGIMEVKCDKLTSIPQVLGAGFSVGIVPYMTIAFENHDFRELRKNIRECLDTVLYIAVPVCFAMLVLSRQVYYVMYGSVNLDYGASVLKYCSILALATTLTPICSSMLMTLHLRGESIFYLCVGFAVKCLTFYPLIKAIGYGGAVMSSVACSMTIIYLSLAKVKNKFGVSYKHTLIRFFKMMIGCLAMNGIFSLLHLAGFNVVETSRVIAGLQIAVYTVAGIAVYAYVTSVMKVPQAIFHRSLPSAIRSFLHGRKH
ncbi:MAG: polysaccharide biosynthesis protein [Erysipelotrichia bacterium]|nr:polysaccharide biosynthesis protein [Erysipelotrichia bacterium]